MYSLESRISQLIPESTPYGLINLELDAFEEAFQSNRYFRLQMVTLKLLTRCNLRCIKCGFWRSAPSVSDELSEDTWQKVVEQLCALKCREVTLSGGEPTLCRFLPDIIRKLHSCGIVTWLFTNGTLLTRNLSRDLVSAGLQRLIISLDGADASTHDRMVGVRGAFARVMDGIRNFAGAVQAVGPSAQIDINTVVTRLNYNKLASLPSLLSDYGVRSIHLAPIQDITAGGSLRLNYEEVEHFSTELFEALQKEGQIARVEIFPRAFSPFGNTSAEWRQAEQGLYSFGIYSRIPCFTPWFQPLIWASGVVYPCSQLNSQEYAMGNVTEEPFVEILNGRKARRMREELKQPFSNRVCARCTICLSDNLILAAKLGFLTSCRFPAGTLGGSEHCYGIGR